jgi:hypothetical protein
MQTTEKFFESFDKVGFLKTALWKPSTGAEVQEARVSFKAPTDHGLAGEALSTDYSITYPASFLIGLKRGEVITIDGQEYTVREGPSSELDESRKQAKLRKGT